MGVILAATAGLIVWIVLWSLNVKALDAFLITLVVVVVAQTVRVVLPYLPGNRPE
jgi:hypothetical protein